MNLSSGNNKGSPLTIALLMSLILLLFACSRASGVEVVQKANIEIVSGLIQTVEARSLMELESLEILDENGTLWKFEARGKRLPEFTPSHLNEHRVLGQKVKVRFHREGEVLVLDGVTD